MTVTLERIFDGDNRLRKTQEFLGIWKKKKSQPWMKNLVIEYERLKNEYQMLNMKYESSEGIIRAPNTTVETQSSFIDNLKRQSTIHQHPTPRINSLTSDSSSNHNDDENNNRQSSLLIIQQSFNKYAVDQTVYLLIIQLK
ncbi:hypothetical protein PPL_00502 [Heterostelium album PN500]|uniref:Uncharacterized protein n=1 Tax=Heterostelium pallidum (strain ATCC 26659 / Pp 5 / PN500) TaxID=670386 RepID=D3AWM7_HETP5|nr:hypothetical protein PPL_00502 [Heterostelium album PN500]EFA86700.1 hypothetical protein PPL_00502 [Heterostelium album PN500]|eukprot:XP_020438804.1 hypothetical protein PPL_00502 [Heterostelium album PN500]